MALAQGPGPRPGPCPGLQKVFFGIKTILQESDSPILKRIPSLSEAMALAQGPCPRPGPCPGLPKQFWGQNNFSGIRFPHLEKRSPQMNQKWGDFWGDLWGDFSNLGGSFFACENKIPPSWKKIPPSFANMGEDNRWVFAGARTH